MRVGTVLASLGLLGVLAVPAVGQEAGPGTSGGLVWSLHGVEFTACVEFLIEPAQAAGLLRDGYRTVPAAAFTPLSSVLAREVAGDPTLGAWVASRLCFAESRSISVADRSYSLEDEREAVGFWGVAATRSAGTPRLDQWYVVQLWVNDWHVEKLTEASYIAIASFKRALDPVPESSNHRYQIKIGKTLLSWTGQMVGRDSTPATPTPPASLIFEGQRRIPWNATLSADPQWARFLPGVLNVQGKDDLAQALKASPIRVFGPMYWGGDARVAFFR
jgi:hypothetical protein